MPTLTFAILLLILPYFPIQTLSRLLTLRPLAQYIHPLIHTKLTTLYPIHWPQRRKQWKIYIPEMRQVVALAKLEDWSRTGKFVKIIHANSFTTAIETIKILASIAQQEDIHVLLENTGKWFHRRMWKRALPIYVHIIRQLDMLAIESELKLEETNSIAITELRNILRSKTLFEFAEGQWEYSAANCRSIQVCKNANQLDITSSAESLSTVVQMFREVSS